MSYSLETLDAENSSVPTGYRIKIGYDEMPYNPRADDDRGVWVMATVSTRNIITIDETYRWSSVPDDAEIVAPIYYSPGPAGGSTYWTRESETCAPAQIERDPDLWEYSSQIGYAYLPAGTLETEGWTVEQATSYLVGEVEEYERWANGEIYAWTLYDDRTGEVLEGVGGYDCIDYARSEAIAEASYLAKQRLKAASDLQREAILAGFGKSTK